MKPSLAGNQTSRGQVAISVHSMQHFFPRVMQSAQIFDQIDERLPDLLVKGGYLDKEAEIDSLVRKGVEGTCPPTESLWKANPDLLSTVREIEDSETSLTSGQAVAFADPFYYTINAMGTATVCAVWDYFRCGTDGAIIDGKYGGIRPHMLVLTKR